MKLKVICLTWSILLALAVGTAFSAEERPDANALFQASKQQKKKIGFVGSYMVPGNVKPTDSSKAFVEGVQAVIDAMETSQPVTLATYGYPSQFTDVETRFGLPKHSKGCVVKDYSVPEKYAGMVSALSWYAERGRYPINSLKSRMATSVPDNLNWLPLAEKGTQGNTHAALYLSVTDEALREVLHKVNPTFSHLTIVLSRDGKEQNVRSMYISPAPMSKWAYDARTKSYWVDATNEYSPPACITGHDMDKGGLLPLDAKPPAGIEWKRIQPNATEGLLIKTEKYGRTMYLKNADGEERRVFSWMRPNAWQDSYWAYDPKTDIVWTKTEGPVTTRIIFQIDEQTAKIIAAFPKSKYRD